MATAQTQDEDLIILSDSIPTTFDENPIIETESQSETNNSIISFDWSDILWLNSISQENTNWIQTENQEKNSDWFNNTLIFSDDLFSWVTQQKKEEENNILNINENENTSIWDIFWQNIEKKEDPKIIENNLIDTTQESSNEIFDLTQNNDKIVDTKTEEKTVNSFFDLNVEEKKQDTQENKTAINNMLDSQIESKSILWDMDDILMTAIDGMKTRQTVINSEKAKKIMNVQEKENYIEKLKEEVNLLYSEINGLDVENDKISMNILNLEDMKLWKSIQMLKTRTHNTKKVIKNIKE